MRHPTSKCRSQIRMRARGGTGVVGHNAQTAVDANGRRPGKLAVHASLLHPTKILDARAVSTRAVMTMHTRAVSVIRLLMDTAQLARRNPEPSLEGPRKGAFGVVTDRHGHLHQGGIRGGEALLGQP
jgi:hypothetical protein